MKNVFKSVALAITFAISLTVGAADEVVEVPADELATETVLPIFRRPIMVKNRNVKTEGRFDANLFYGYAMTEPIADVSKLGLSLYYNVNEEHAVGLLFTQNSTGLSTYSKQLAAKGLDLRRVPSPEQTFLIDYNWKAFYGKMSFSKELVFNTSLFLDGSVGAVKFVHKTYPAVTGGLGTKIYFTNRLALRADLRLYVHEAPNPFIGQGLIATNPAPKFSDFADRLTFTTNLDVGLSFLF